MGGKAPGPSEAGILGEDLGEGRTCIRPSFQKMAFREVERLVIRQIKVESYKNFQGPAFPERYLCHQIQAALARQVEGMEEDTGTPKDKKREKRLCVSLCVCLCMSTHACACGRGGQQLCGLPGTANSLKGSPAKASLPRRQPDGQTSGLQNR